MTTEIAELVVGILQFLALLGGLIAILKAANKLGVFQGGVLERFESIEKAVMALGQRMERGFAANHEYHKELDRKVDKHGEEIASLKTGCKYLHKDE